MIRYILFLQLCLFSIQVFSQQGQLSISRVDQMPDSPPSLSIRDWDAVARNYDQLVFDLNKTGTHWPLSRTGTQGQFNYPDNTPLFLDSYVGADNHLNQAEAINILPAIVGASLTGIDKSNQNGMNWAAMAKDFFNLKNNQNVYLNNYSTSSGNDWWYDLMPNVYFYQLKELYPDAAPQFDSQFASVADQWLKAVQQLGGSSSPWTVPNMNYRAFNLATGQPQTGDVAEPESAGSLAWLLYNAYLETGNREYIEGAQQSMDFLASLTSNPSYELQLPYGTLTAARMNAVEGTSYPMDKLLNWCFDRGPLRGWGAIVGNWNGYEVSGLIGEANDNGNDYAFVMNGFQQAAALAPLAKYDKRYARAIAKWLLNVSSASRLFYHDALPAENQDSYAWASANDPEASIPYEALKQTWQGKSPFATGDALRGEWAATNLSLYSGSSVGYLAAVVETTTVREILQIDLNKTDFYGENTFPSYMYFNPTTSAQQVTVNVPEGTFAVYDAITEATLSPSVSSTYPLSIPAGEVRLIRFYASSLTTENREGQLYAGDEVLDYRFGYDFTAGIRVKALSVSQNPVVTGSSFTAFCEPGNILPDDQVQYEWFLNDVPVEGQKQVTITAPESPSEVILRCRVSLNGQTDEDTLQLKVVSRIVQAPVVTDIEFAGEFIPVVATVELTAVITPTSGEVLDYAWSATAGMLVQATGQTVSWQAPASSQVDTITVVVTNQDQLSTTFSKAVLVKDPALAEQEPLIWYPFDADDRNLVSDRFHATVTGAAKTEDARGRAELAYRFTSGQQIIFTENQPELNFTQAVSLSCWVKAEMLGAERYLISHGSWQQRYKLSIIPEGKLRWTVKTSAGIVDLDAAEPLELNRYYHVTALYTGYSVELYVDGALSAFKAFTGDLLASTRPLTIGRQDEVETQYSLLGSIDEVKVWDKEIPVSQVEKLKDQWWVPVGVDEFSMHARVYPNPANEKFNIDFAGAFKPLKVTLFSVDGMKVMDYSSQYGQKLFTMDLPESLSGIYLLQIIMDNGKVISQKIVIR
ncbi:MAG TPA: LamG-like jellyroll fold domain-containing protein [Prolixibacteraceae bacterium]|nr:LamG-like jellyroll fold domain-containing protein [Prolixibacteraceae bacterium]